MGSSLRRLLLFIQGNGSIPIRAMEPFSLVKQTHCFLPYIVDAVNKNDEEVQHGGRKTIAN